jgi:hypothetical protein
MEQMTEAELLTFIERQETRAVRTDVAQEQATAMDYYLRRPFGNEEEGRSQVVSSDVFDVVEGMIPNVLDPFVSSSDAVVFNAVGPEDEEAAKQETDYVNYVVTQKNDSFTQFLAWGKAGLLQKNGIVKYWWDTTHQVSIQTLRGLSLDEYTSLRQDAEITILGVSENDPTPIIDPGIQQGELDAMPPAQEPTYDVKIRRREKDGNARYAVVPPEEFLIIGRDPNPQKAPFVQHKTRVTLSDLREMGYDIDDDLNDNSDGGQNSDPQAAARNRELDSQALTNADGDGDPSMREVWLRETYCRVDFDGDGVAELRKICKVGKTLLKYPNGATANEETEEIPFAAWTPYQQLFQFDGRCPADEAIEFQDVKTTILRQGLDNIYTVNNNRVYANENVNMDDLLDNQIAGVVRVGGKGPVGDNVHALPITPLGEVILPMIEYIDSAKENRTGFTRYNQGSDSDSLNKTATGVRLITAAGNQRTRLIQRSLAEQGMKPLMLGIHGLIRRHATKPDTVRLRGKWVTLDPRSWRRREDMTVSVGLGTNDKQLELGSQSEILKMQAGLAPAGIVTPENQYNAATKYVELTGEKNPDKFFTHPEKMPQKQPPDPMQDPKVMLEVAGHKLDEAKFQKESEQKDRELDQADRALDQADAQLGISQANAQLDALERQHKLQLETEAHMREMAAPHPQELAAGNQALAADQQQHQQAMNEQSQELEAQKASQEASQATQETPSE